MVVEEHYRIVMLAKASRKGHEEIYNGSNRVVRNPTHKDLKMKEDDIHVFAFLTRWTPGQFQTF